jgi:hypothetical protein
MDQKKTWEEQQAEKAAKMKPIKQMIIGECARIMHLLEQNAESNQYGYSENAASELFAKMHELRRDTITLEKLQKGR